MIKDIATRKIFFTLLVSALVSVACVFPYVLTVQKDVIATIPMPLGALFAAQFLQSSIMFAITISLGMFLAGKNGFGLPLLNAYFKNKNWISELKKILGLSVFLGIIIALAIYILDYFFAAWGTGISTHNNYAPVWQKLLASFYGGVVEEILMRLFLMSLFIWLGARIFRQSKPASSVIIISNLLSAIIFGLGHLPMTASVTTITAIVVMRAVILNGIGGVVFGWLFWKKGLESAIIAHFTTDIFLLSLLPMLLR